MPGSRRRRVPNNVDIMLKPEVKPVSMRRRIILIVLFFMLVLILFQSSALLLSLRQDEKQKVDYIDNLVGGMAVSLDGIGQNLESMGSYIRTYDAFQKLYNIKRDYSENMADSVYSAFHTVQFMSVYYPIIEDVIIVNLNGVGLSYYEGLGYDSVGLIGNQYDFTDPGYTKTQFFYFQNEDYFAYVVPISEVYDSNNTVTSKIATAIFLCKLDDIQTVAHIDTSDKNINFSIYDRQQNLVATNGETPAGGNTLKTTSVSEKMGLTVVATGLSSPKNDEFGFLTRFYGISAGVIFLLMILMIVALQRIIVKPISALVNETRGLGRRVLHKRLSLGGTEEINNLVVSFNSMLDEIEVTTSNIFSTQDKLHEMETLKTGAEIRALQSQINPHFLYNTLQCIRGMAILNNAPKISDIALAMSELFRYSASPLEYVSISEELEIVRKYILITNIRFQDRFKFIMKIDPQILPVNTGKMMIQPLIENAVFHGVSKLEDGGTVWINGIVEGNTAIIEVIDNGPGFDAGSLEEIKGILSSEKANNAEKCLGLYNINRRIALHYGGDYGIDIVSADGLTTVKIRLPIDKNG